MSQALPVLPQLPVRDGHKPDRLQRPADSSDRAGQRQSFGKLLDRFTERDVAKDTSREPTREPAADAKTAEPDARPGTIVDASSESAEAEPAQATPEPAGSTTVAPTAIPMTAQLPAMPAASAELQASAPVVQAGETAIQTAEPSIVAAVASPVPAQQPVANDNAPTATLPTPAASTVAAGAAAAAPQPEAAAQAAGADRAAVPTMPSDMAAIDAANAGAKPAAAAAEQNPAANAAAAAAQPRLVPAAKTVPAPAETGDLNLQARQDGKAQPGPAAVLADPLAAAAGRAEDAAAGKATEQPVSAFMPVDSPRNAAAQYHRVAETVRTAAAETPSPTDQVSIRLLHAVAEGKRTIQMHLHPAELGSIDVRMQWQGDRLTAQFQVDRPETLQLLQREVPALERTLNQAGVNVDSGSLSFSLRQQTGNGQNGNGQPFDPAAANAAFGDGTDLPLGDEPLGQVIRDGLLSIRV